MAPANHGFRCFFFDSSSHGIPASSRVLSSRCQLSERSMLALIRKFVACLRELPDGF